MVETHGTAPLSTQIGTKGLRVTFHVDHSPTIFKCEEGENCADIDGIWWGRVRMCQL